MGGKSSTAKVPTYYMSVHFGLCHGPVDAVTAIYAGEKLAWSGRITGNETLSLNHPELFGGLKKEGGLRGQVEVMFGGSDQLVSWELANRLGDTPSRLPGFRGLLSFFFRGSWDPPGFYWAASNPYLKPLWFTVENIPRDLGGPYAEINREVQRDAPPVDVPPEEGGGPEWGVPTGDPSGKVTIIEKDANPAHIIYTCLMNPDWGMGEDPAAIDAAAFQSVAETLYNEKLGLSLAWSQAGSIENFVNDILQHINGAIFTHPRTGLITIRLLRDDYDRDTARVVNPDNAVMRNFARKGWGETVNEMKVSWTNPENEQSETVYSQDLGNIAIQGSVVSDSRNYHGVRSAELAQELCDRELRVASAPLSSAELELDRSFWDITPFEVLKLEWPENNIAGLYVRVMEVSYGTRTDPKIKVSVLEDVFSLPQAAFTTPPRSSWVDPTRWPVPAGNVRILPAPAYALLHDEMPLDQLAYPSTYAMLLVPSPYSSGSAHFDVEMQEATPAGTSEWEVIRSQEPFAGRGRLIGPLSPAATSVIPLPGEYTGPRPVENHFLVIGDTATPDEELELALVTAVDTFTGSLTIRRGVLDTAPREWPAGTQVLSIAAGLLDPLEQEFLEGQTISARIAVVTPRGRTSGGHSTLFTNEAKARATKPLRPANVKLNGQGFGTPELTTDFDLTWSHRNRMLEDVQVLSWTDPSTPIEDGVTYRVEIDARDGTGQTVEANWYAEDVGAVTEHSVDLTGLTIPPSAAWLTGRVAAIRDGERSWQEYEISGLLPPGAVPLVVGSSTYSSVLDGSASVVLPDNVQEGDLLVAFVMHRSPIYVPAGWTPSVQTDIYSSNQRITMFTKVATTEDANATVTWDQEATWSPSLMCAFVQVIRASETPSVWQVEPLAQIGVSTLEYYIPELTGLPDTLVLSAGSSNFARISPPDSFQMQTPGWVQTSPDTNQFRESQIRLGVAYQQIHETTEVHGHWIANFTPDVSGWGALTVMIGVGDPPTHTFRSTTQGDRRVTTQGDRRITPDEL